MVAAVLSAGSTTVVDIPESEVRAVTPEVELGYHGQLVRVTVIPIN